MSEDEDTSVMVLARADEPNRYVAPGSVLAHRR